MIPIPDPYRLFPPKLPPSSGGSGPGSDWAEIVLALGAFPVAFLAAIAICMLMIDWSCWLVVPAFLVGLYGVLFILLKGSIILAGIIEVIFYSGITFVILGGLGGANTAPAWIVAGIVAALFLWVTYSVWKKR